VPATDRTDPDPGAEPTPPARSRSTTAWRLGTPLVVTVVGALFVVSATNSQGTDLRPGRYTDLASLTEAESRSYEHLQGEATHLGTEVDRLTRDVDDERVRRAGRKAAALRSSAGLEAVSGPGVRIVLSDAPEDVLEAALADADGDDPAADVNLQPLVVHQQDIQAVVNALWVGGARAVTVQGQRIVTTTGIKCTGSAVQLQGVPYPQPYTIEAVGDPADLVAAIDGDAWTSGFRADAARPEVGVGWELGEQDRVEAPAYDGLLDIELARPQPR
jgi:uncharacterized protein YlxW (UPF0749 family)